MSSATNETQPTITQATPAKEAALVVTSTSPSLVAFPAPPATKTSSPSTQLPPSQIPTQFRAISRNNSNTSTASSSNKGDLSSTISTANSITSSRSQLSRLIDHRQLFASCAINSTPIRSFQRATISSAVKTRAFDKDPILQNLLATPSASGQNSVSNSQTPSPHSTPIFSRSRSLRMSGGPNRFGSATATASYRTSSRTPDLYSSYNNSSDIMIASHNNDSHIKLKELNNEKIELKESLEFLECERQVLIDTSRELKDTLQTERSQWKKEIEELKKQLTDQIRIRVKAESEITRIDMELNNSQRKLVQLNEDLAIKTKHIGVLERRLITLQTSNKELIALNDELKLMLSEKFKFNGLTRSSDDVIASIGSPQQQQVSDCVSIITEMARLRLELNEKERIIDDYSRDQPRVQESASMQDSTITDIDTLNNFLNQTVECIKSWPKELAESSHVQTLMKTLLGAYKKDPTAPITAYSMVSQLDNVHL